MVRVARKQRRPTVCYILATAEQPLRLFPIKPGGSEVASRWLNPARLSRGHGSGPEVVVTEIGTCPAAKGEPIDVNAPVTPSMRYPETLLSPLFAT